MGKEKTDRIERAKAVVRGAICGDVIGSRYEFHSTKFYDFVLFNWYSRFTDDTVCTIAVTDALISGEPFEVSLKKWCRRFPHVGYGGAFCRWFMSENTMPYGSWGNGSAMRVSSTGAFAKSAEEALELSGRSAAVTHNHPEGIKGAQSVALAIFMALEGASKQQIKDELEQRFGYALSRDYERIKATYDFDVSCQGSVPEAIISFLGSTDYESAIRRAIALGGDADTQAAIAGAIAAAFYGQIPDHILLECMNRVDSDLKSVVERFDQVLEQRHGGE
ncbi:MAG: ADP-ribosylglycohydrolase family protein [Paramuribaculum sp.]|nr:ADP-ribosylglycohydrolase family protein [Paramuribaculum sp.]